MTREEKRIWQAAYGAAFAALTVSADDDSPKAINAIRAARIADSAVAALRDRRASGDPRAGKHLW